MLTLIKNIIRRPFSWKFWWWGYKEEKRRNFKYGKDIFCPDKVEPKENLEGMVVGQTRIPKVFLEGMEEK